MIPLSDSFRGVGCSICLFCFLNILAPSNGGGGGVDLHGNAAGGGGGGADAQSTSIKKIVNI